MVILRIVLVALLALVASPVVAQATTPDEPVVLIVFWGQGCPHCAEEFEFLDGLGAEFPDLEIVSYEVRYHRNNWDLFVESMDELGLKPRAVPTTILGDLVWEGFSESIGVAIREAVVAAMSSSGGHPPEEHEVVVIPILGEYEIGDVPLVMSTVLIALVDGINPCSLWVLSILLALVLRSGSRRRVLLIGGTFLVVTTLLYGLYIAGAYSLLAFAAGQTWVRILMAVVALGFGIVSLKEYFQLGTGISLGIPQAQKPRIYQRMRAVSLESKSIFGAVAGTVLLAAGVSILETPCTAGFPLLWANLLAEEQVGLAAAAPLFLLYMGVFLIDELVVFGTAVVAMRVAKLEERAGRVLRLIGGMVMITLALTLVLAPRAMTSLAGSLSVFGVAMALVLLVLAFGWWRERNGHKSARKHPAQVVSGRRDRG
jgi:cytochrome c biogenesis protein CcdA